MPARGPKTMKPKSAEPGPSRKKAAGTFSDDERAVMKDLAHERKVVWGKDRKVDEAAVLARIQKLPASDRAMSERVHALVTAAAPDLAPRLWYGMPAYTKDGNVLCFFQPAGKFKARYSTIGFTDKAKLDDGATWPTYFAVKELTRDAEATVSALVKRAAR